MLVDHLSLGGKTSKNPPRRSSVSQLLNSLLNSFFRPSVPTARCHLISVNAFKFCLAISDCFHGLPESKFIEVVVSPDIRELISNHVTKVGDGIRHFVISTNDDLCCEVIADGYD